MDKLERLVAAFLKGGFTPLQAHHSSFQMNGGPHDVFVYYLIPPTDSTRIEALSQYHSYLSKLAGKIADITETPPALKDEQILFGQIGYDHSRLQQSRSRLLCDAILGRPCEPTFEGTLASFIEFPTEKLAHEAFDLLKANIEPRYSIPTGQPQR